MNNETNSENKILPTRSETLSEVIDSFFAVKGRNYLSVLTVLFGVLILSWVADSLLPIIQDLSVLFFYELNFTSFFAKSWENLLKLLFPLILFLVVLFSLYKNRRRNLESLSYGQIASEPHQGLIISLSDYQDFSKQLPTIQHLEEAIANNNLNIENFFNTSNWGQTAFLISHHAPLLQKCWVVTTPKSSKMFGAVQRLINYVSANGGGREITCEEVKILDENNIGETATQISRIYKSLKRPEGGLTSDQVIANFTGGTAAMSGGIILATLDEGRRIEYVSQQFRGDLNFELLRDNYKKFAVISPTTNLIIAERLSRNDYE